MCYELYHICRFCNNQYQCELENWICPTVNHDEDSLMCDNCRALEANAFKKWAEEHPDAPIPNLEDWNK